MLVKEGPPKKLSSEELKAKLKKEKVKLRPGSSLPILEET